MRTRLVVVVTVLLATAIGPRSSAQAAAPHRVPWLGVMVDGPLIERDGHFDGDWSRIRASGAGFVRASLYWRDAEPANPSTRDWSAADRIVGNAARQRLPLLAVVGGAPPWARTQHGSPASSPKDPADYTRFVRTLVERYGPSGRFWREHPELPRRPVRMWQVWNEPDIVTYWTEPNWAKGYARLLRATYPVVKRADPGATVVAAGLTNESWKDLQRLYDHGIRGHYDALAAQVYTAQPAGVVEVLRRFRETARANGDATVPIWLTEFGWPASSGLVGTPTPWDVTATLQAARVTEAIRLLAAARKRLGIAKVSWYTWASRPSQDAWTSFSGLRRVVGDTLVTTAALRTFERLTRRLAAR